MVDTTKERLEAKIWVNPETGCWEWTGARDVQGYGRLRCGQRPQVAHRVAYVLYVELIPEGLTLDHLCRNRSCVNPDHLEPVTHQENVRRGYPGQKPKTHCKNGHPFTAENTYNYEYGRRCKTCTVERQRKDRERPQRPA